MLVILLGLLLWTIPHVYKAAAPASHAALVGQWGEGPVKIAVTAASVLAIALMVWGYAIEGGYANVFTPPTWGWHLNNLLMLFSMILLGAGHMKSNVRQVIRHPMLTAALIWSVAHILANGTGRAVLLFGGLGAWAVLHMILLNRRDGAWVRPPKSPVKKDAIAIVAGVVVYGAVAMIHWKVFGLSPFPS
ncbi:MAG: NnrU family protein [Rubrimonas sp.]|uniref:NnrU family protein n=1 Tax=Rubrimonas sp. TaxID=2036015 RepID=UPI002FDD8685